MSAKGLDTKLVNILTSIPAFFDEENRSFLLRGLPKDLAATIKRHLAPLADLHSIVKTALSSGHLYDLDKLAGYDLRLMSWGDGTSVPTSGQDLVIAGTDGDGLLHIRTFDAAGVRTDTFEGFVGRALRLVSADASGRVLSDTPESSLPAARAQAIVDLKQRLPGWLPPHVLSDAERGQVFGDATSITGQTQLAIDVVLDNVLPFVQGTEHQLELDAFRQNCKAFKHSPPGSRPPTTAVGWLLVFVVSALAVLVLLLWHPWDKRPKATRIKETGLVEIAFSTDGHTMAAAIAPTSGSGVVLGNTDKVKSPPLDVREGRVTCVAVSPDGKTVAAGFTDDSSTKTAGVVVWNADRHERLWSEPLRMPKNYVTGLAFNPDGKTLAVGISDLGVSAGGAVLIWDMERRQQLSKVCDVSEGVIKSLAFSRNGAMMAAGFFNSQSGHTGVVLWDVGLQARLGPGPLNVPEGVVLPVAFSPVDDTLAAGFANSGRDGGGVVLWETLRRSRLGDAPLTLREGAVQVVAFSPDGRTLAAGFRGTGGVGGVTLWDVARRVRLGSGQALKVTEPSEPSISGLAFRSDGKALTAGFIGKGGIGGLMMTWQSPLKFEQKEE
jgi:WD40 repeat protein